MDARFILALCFGITCPNRKVNSATDLFIEQHVLGKSLNAIIRADAPFTKEARTAIGVECRSEQLLILIGFFLYHFAVLEPKLYICNLLPAIDSRILESHPTIGRVFNGTCEDLSTRKILLACRFDKWAIFDRKRDIHIGALDHGFCASFEPACQ